MREALNRRPAALRARVLFRSKRAVEIYKLDEVRDTSLATYPCPLFEKGIGCLVHSDAKPFPCIAHACYAQQTDLPPENLLDAAELAVERINLRTYGQSTPPVPIPIALVESDRRSSNQGWLSGKPFNYPESPSTKEAERK
jgi:hypothetical protein